MRSRTRHLRPPTTRSTSSCGTGPHSGRRRAKSPLPACSARSWKGSSPRHRCEEGGRRAGLVRLSAAMTLRWTAATGRKAYRQPIERRERALSPRGPARGLVDAPRVRRRADGRMQIGGSLRRSFCKLGCGTRRARARARGARRGRGRREPPLEGPRWRARVTLAAPSRASGCLKGRAANGKPVERGFGRRRAIAGGVSASASPRNPSTRPSSGSSAANARAKARRA